MIKLIKQPGNSLKNIETNISSAYRSNQLIQYYKEIIKNYKKLDDKYHFTEALDEEYIFSQIGQLLENDKINAPLFAIPFGIKDIFNTKVLATSMGSAIWRGFKAGNNARIVDEVADRGGIIFSKLTTAEFAVHFISPEKTLNPYNSKHITGTSSSGSAVAVATGALPIAFGTQTAGSITRPASFCGVYGFKPSFGAIDRTGILKTNDTLDTVGILGSDIYGIKKTFQNSLQQGKNYPYSLNYFEQYKKFKEKEKKEYKIGILSSAFAGFDNYADYVKEDFNNVVSIISKSFNTTDIKAVTHLNEIHPLHENMYSKSLSYYFQNEIKHYNEVSPVMTDMIRRGERIHTEEYIEAIKLQPRFKKVFDEELKNYDFIITPSTATAAPVIGTVELPDTSLIWTFVGYPTLSIPAFFNEDLNLPYGLQIVAKKFDDFSLLDFGESIENLLK
jgi:Asp-tRNA(Asn)/Glu-tRNA(Gln) amidotransferase A subunit family amidase